MTKAKAYYQAYLVLKCLSKEEYSLIPKPLLTEITTKMEKDPNIKVDSSIPLEEQKIDEKAYDILDKVIKAIERAYGADAIDNPEKYAQETDDESEDETFKQEKAQLTDIEIDIENDIEIVEKDKNKKKPKESNRQKDDNLKLQNIMEALKEETEKVEKAKELYYNYKEIVAKKDEKIRLLMEENEELKRSNEELHESIEKVPKIIRKIFVKDASKLLSSGERHKIP